jgi:hypothetical protein
MNKNDEHPLIAFAGKFGDPQVDYLNASTAIARVESLLEDAKSVSCLLEADCPEDHRWHPWFGAEALSYYAVGYVTCLEWHAKSRLVDLLTFRPTALKITDVQKTITDKLIVQMVSKQASVTQLVGAALKVGSLNTYLSVISRVFEELSVPCSIKDWLTGNFVDSNVCWLKSEQLALVDQMFEFRHMLVHELGIATMGHPNVRDAWTPEDAKTHGHLVASLICGIEAALTRYAPDLFPNLLSNELYPVDPADTLRAEFERRDADINAAFLELDSNESRTKSVWQTARAKFKEYLEAEEAFISEAGVLHWRYFDARTPLRVRLLNYRIGFLSELSSHLGTSADDDPEA